jgi:putative N6-adenine-specific DNA methylase
MQYKIVIKTLFGLENLLVNELEQLGISEIEVLNRAVQFNGSLGDIYKCNLHLRTALSVLANVKTGKVINQDQLYSFVKGIKWDEYFDCSKSIAVNSVTNSKQLNHTLFIAQKTKDAVVDYFRYKTGDRPDVDVKNPDIKIMCI